MISILIFDQKFWRHPKFEGTKDFEFEWEQECFPSLICGDIFERDDDMMTLTQLCV